MKKQMVTYTLETLPPISDERWEEMKKLAARPDSEIDTSDIPELTKEQWKDAVRGRFGRPLQQEVTFQVDANVLEWLKAQEGDYQSRINAILRREMLATFRQS